VGWLLATTLTLTLTTAARTGAALFLEYVFTRNLNPFGRDIPRKLLGEFQALFHIFTFFLCWILKDFTEVKYCLIKQGCQ